MDPTQGFSLGSLISILVILIAYIAKINHKRIRSTCCNQLCITSIDVEATTPPEELKIKLPSNTIE